MHSPQEHIEPIGKFDLWVSGQNFKKSFKIPSYMAPNKAYFPISFLIFFPFSGEQIRTELKFFASDVKKNI